MTIPMTSEFTTRVHLTEEVLYSLIVHYMGADSEHHQ
jgi:hypothetical protein